MRIKPLLYKNNKSVKRTKRSIEAKCSKSTIFVSYEISLSKRMDDMSKMKLGVANIRINATYVR